MPPKLVVHALKEGLELARKNEGELRLEVASLEGRLAQVRADLIEHQEAIKYIEDFNATQSIL